MDLSSSRVVVFTTAQITFERSFPKLDFVPAMKLYLSGEKIGVSIVEQDVEEAFGKFGKLGEISQSAP